MSENRKKKTENARTVSFGLGGKLLVLAEHQSTVNENMPLRSLLYIGRAFEQIVPVKDRYRRKKVLLPKPEINVRFSEITACS